MSSARDSPSSPASAMKRKQNEILDTAQAILRLPHTGKQRRDSVT